MISEVLLVQTAMLANSRYILFGESWTRSLMVEMVMAEGAVNYELRKIDIFQEQHQSPEFLEINPLGWIPALITPEGTALYETHAINLYLAEKHQLTHIAPRIDDPERGYFLSGLFSISGDLEPTLKRYFYPHRYAVRECDRLTIKEKSLEAILHYIEVVDQRLSQNGPYHLGERFSLVDLALSYWCTYFEPSGALEPYLSVGRCMELVMERPMLQPHFDMHIFGINTKSKGY